MATSESWLQQKSHNSYPPCFGIHGAIATRNPASGGASSIGNQLISKGQYQWKIKIIELEGYPMRVGIVSETERHYLKYAYSTDGTVVSRNKWRDRGETIDLSKLCHKNMKIKYGINDIIGLHLDLDKRTVQFSKNNQTIFVFKNVVKQSYRFAVKMPRVPDYFRSAATKIQMLSFGQPKEDQEKKQQNHVNDVDDMIVPIPVTATDIFKQNILFKQQYSNDKIEQFDSDKMGNTLTYFDELETEIKRYQNEVLKAKEILKRKMEQNHKTMQNKERHKRRNNKPCKEDSNENMTAKS
eukprot:355813_1